MITTHCCSIGIETGDSVSYLEVQVLREIFRKLVDVYVYSDAVLSLSEICCLCFARHLFNVFALNMRPGISRTACRVFIMIIFRFYQCYVTVHIE